MADGSVAGMLLYARTDEGIQPDEDYLMSGNRISVKTLDLNRDFSDIRAQPRRKGRGRIAQSLPPISQKECPERNPPGAS